MTKNITTIRSKEICSGGATFTYELQKGIINNDGEFFDSYSIRVKYMDSSANTSSSVAKDITCNITDAERLLELISSGLVTPLTLTDIAEDFIASL